MKLFKYTNFTGNPSYINMQNVLYVFFDNDDIGVYFSLEKYITLPISEADRLKEFLEDKV